MEREVLAVSGVDPFASRLTVVHLVDPRDEGVRPHVEAIEHHESRGGWRVRVYADTPSPAPARLRKGARRMWREITRSRPDVVVAHGLSAGLLGRLAIRGRIPTVYLRYECERCPSGRLAGVVRQWERLAAAWTNVAVLPTAEASEWFVRSRIRVPLVTLPEDRARDDDLVLGLIAAVIARAHAFGHTRPGAW